MTEGADTTALDLTEDEWHVLLAGLGQWGGPTDLTDSWALALGFNSKQHFGNEVPRLERLLERRQPLQAQDWLRVIHATELVFINDMVGAGVEWSITTGFTDEDTVALLRSIQEKWMDAAYG